MKNLKLTIFIITLILAACSPAFSEKKELFTADFSTPEAAFNTSFYAVKNHLYEVILDSMSKDYRKNFGVTRSDQMTTLQNGAQRHTHRSDWQRIIVKVEEDASFKQEGYDARVVYNEYEGGKTIFLKARMPMIKEQNQWKIAAIKQPAPTAQQIAEAEESKKILKRNYVLDEKTKTIVEVDKSSSQSRSK